MQRKKKKNKKNRMNRLKCLTDLVETNRFGSFQFENWKKKMENLWLGSSFAKNKLKQTELLGSKYINVEIYIKQCHCLNGH